MKLESLQPKTLAGIKSLARDLQKAQQIPYNQALTMASGQGGFANWKAALNHFSALDAISFPTGFPLYITAWWFDAESKQSGRETLCISMAQPIRDLVNPRQMRMKRYLGWKRLEAPDHLVDKRRYDSQGQARMHVAGAARTLAFMEATGLKPTSSKFREFGPFDDDFSMPGRDHYATWVDPDTKLLVLTDEPYRSRIEREGAQFTDKRLTWAKKNNWIIEPVEWEGIYYPDGGSKMFLAGPKAAAALIGDLVRRLNALPAAVGSIEWTGESDLSFEEFVTPAGRVIREAKAAAKALRSQAPQVRGPRNSISYVKSFGGKRKSRPDSKLPLEMHRALGALLKEATLYSKPRLIPYALNQVRTELDDWLALEYPGDELSHREFVEVYYGGVANPAAFRDVDLDTSVPRHLVTQLKELLVAGYPDCAPMRAMVKRIDKALEGLRS